jgi:hypothetical protein
MTLSPLPRQLRVVPWLDPVVERNAHPLHSEYVSRYYLPVLGPSAMWALRLMVADMQSAVDRGADPLAGTVIDSREFSHRLGLGSIEGVNAPLIKTLKRLILFDVAIEDGEALAVRRRLPWLNERHLHRFTATMRREHHAAQRKYASETVAHHRARARSLALTLFRLGDAPGAIRWQLQHWNLTDLLIDDAMAWASKRVDQAS